MALQSRIVLHRTVLAVCWLGCSAALLAEPLYRWTEADGSITFSPNKPAAGIEYVIVEKPAASGKMSPLPVVDTPMASTALRKAPEPAPQAQHDADSDDLLLPPVSGEPNIRRQDAVGHQGITRSDRLPGVVNRAAPAQQDNVGHTKRNRCDDLRKRVVSLERRLKSRLTPEDMDNTVIHMARYQRSFNQHCVQ